MSKYQHSFLKMETSEALQQAAEEKIDHIIEKFLITVNLCRLSYSVIGNENKIHCHLSSSDKTFEAEAKGENMYAVLDKIIDKVESQLRSLKGKKDRSSRRDSIKDLPLKDSPMEEYMDHEIKGEDIVKLNKS